MCGDVWSRTQNSPNAHVKAFASEILTLIVCLIAFSDFVLLPQRVLLREVRCLRTLHTITFILQDSELAVACACSGRLDQLFKSHTEQFLVLYPSCAKPKIHYGNSVPKQLRVWRQHLNCFATERRHKQSKRLAAFIFKKLGTVLLRRCVINLLQGIQHPQHLDAFHIPKPKENGRSLWVDIVRQAGFEIHSRGTCMNTPVGTVYVDDFVLFQLDEVGPGGVRWGGGTVVECVHGLSGDNVEPFVIVASATLVNAEVTPNRCTFRRGVLRVLVHGCRVLRRMPFIEDGGEMHLIFPESARELLP